MPKQFLYRLLVLIGAFFLLSGFGSSHHRHPPQSMNITHEPTHIALLLPLSGQYADAARAIREGFLASYYSNPRHSKPTVRVYDTSRADDVQKIYDEALRQGADFVVGPLSKEDVFRLSQLSPREARAPILALNYHPQARMPTKHFVQFSLLPEQEAEQIAQKLSQKGYRRAVVMAVNNAWGQRVVQAFTERFRSQGGHIVQTVFASPSDDQSAAVRQLLNISDKQKRAIETRKTSEDEDSPLAQLQSTIDVIVLVTSSSQARQLKPLFDFYYAYKTPVYATSSVYNGYPSPETDNDLNGIVFCDMPGLIHNSKNSELQHLLNRPENKGSEYSRLFAMGMDAYRLTTELDRLRAGQSYVGTTGQLYLSQQHIHRNLSWAKMVKGVPQALGD